MGALKGENRKAGLPACLLHESEEGEGDAMEMCCWGGRCYSKPQPLFLCRHHHQAPEGFCQHSAPGPVICLAPCPGQAASLDPSLRGGQSCLWPCHCCHAEGQSCLFLSREPSCAEITFLTALCLPSREGGLFLTGSHTTAWRCTLPLPCPLEMVFVMGLVCRDPATKVKPRRKGGVQSAARHKH